VLTETLPAKVTLQNSQSTGATPKISKKHQSFESGSRDTRVADPDPDSIGSVDPDPDPGGQK